MARGVEGISVCGLIWFDGMRALAARAARKRRGGMSSLLGRSGSGRPLSTYYFMRLLYYVRDASI